MQKNPEKRPLIKDILDCEWITKHTESKTPNKVSSPVKGGKKSSDLNIIESYCT